MPTLDSYLFFDGQCAEAMRFYERTLGGRMEALMTYAQSPDPAACAPGDKDRVMHACIALPDGPAPDGACVANGGACGASSECCSTNCDTRLCVPAGCLDPGIACTTGAECCSGTCTADVCAPRTACATFGMACTTGGDCCSNSCANTAGMACGPGDSGCACAPSMGCLSGGDPCTDDAACCNGLCDRPGGAAMLVPDYVRETFRPSTSHGGAGGNGRGLRYLEWVWDPDPSDSTYFADYAYLLRKADGTVRAEHDRHVEGLFSRAEWLETIAAAGFEPRVVPFEHSETEPMELLLGIRPRR